MAKFVKVYTDKERKFPIILNLDHVQKIGITQNGEQLKFHYISGDEVNAFLNETELRMLKNKLDVPL
ncbi:hypothetical protein [uncultured Draconibacterium sp.]|uniref:hypothetical protein n=1 Tax=uncultured Draconibacterium sp. TaxID=1573823 RepID=UPI0029C8DA86|nr:hypothetical protein [uncultured Draconibacterium sp.]